jgi:hypothetical protein
MSHPAVLIPCKGEASAVTVKVPRTLKAQATLTVDGVGTFSYVCSNTPARLSFYEPHHIVTRPSDLISKSVSLPVLLSSYLFCGPLLIVADGGPQGAVSPLPLPAWKSALQAHAATSAAALKRMHFVNGGRAQPKFSLQLNPLTRAVVVVKGAAKESSKEGRKKLGRGKKAASKKSRHADDEADEMEEDEDEDEEDEDEEVQDDEEVQEDEEAEGDDDCDNDNDGEDEDEEDELDDNSEENEKDNNIDADDDFPGDAAETEPARQTKFTK